MRFIYQIRKAASTKTGACYRQRRVLDPSRQSVPYIQANQRVEDDSLSRDAQTSSRISNQQTTAERLLVQMPSELSGP